MIPEINKLFEGVNSGNIVSQLRSPQMVFTIYFLKPNSNIVKKKKEVEGDQPKKAVLLKVEMVLNAEAAKLAKHIDQSSLS